MFVLVKRKSPPTISMSWVNSMQGHKRLKSRSHKPQGNALFNPRRHPIWPTYLIYVSDLIYSSTISRRKKLSFSSAYTQNVSMQDNFFLTKYYLQYITIPKNTRFPYIPNIAEKVSFPFFCTAFVYSEHFYILFIWASKQPWNIIHIFAEKEAKDDST